MAAKVQTIGDVKDTEEQGLSPGNLLLTHSDQHAAKGVIEIQGGEVHHVSTAANFHRIQTAAGVVVVVFKEFRLLLVETFRSGSDAVRVVIIVIAYVEDGAQTGVQLYVGREIDGGIELAAELVHVELAVRRFLHPGMRYLQTRHVVACCRITC